MFRYVPVVTAAVLVVASMNAEARSPQPRPATGVVQSDRSGSFTAFAGMSAAGQSDDLAAKVKAKLQADPDLASQSSELTVTGAAGIVTLEGTVPSVQIRARIAETVMKVEGVTKVNNKIKLAKK